MIYLCTKFQMPCSSISVIVTNTTVILESINTNLTKVAYLLEIYHHPSVQSNELTGTSVVLTS
jgi:hypothetical protein